MGCCGGHFEMHDERERRRRAGSQHDHGPADSTLASDAMPVADAEAREPFVNRWIAPVIFGAAVAILYFIFR